MEANDSPELSVDSPAASGRRQAIRVVSLVLWGAVIAIEAAAAFSDPSLATILLASCFVALFTLVNAQLFLVQWMARRNWRSLVSKMHGSSYLSDLHDLPNRNYLLSELRREMPRARSSGTPFVLLLISFDTVDEIRVRRGDDFADRAVNALVDVLKRVTRHSDFIAHLGGARFCVMLSECTSEQSWLYMRRVPGSIAVSDGHHMYDVPVSARMFQYDLESLYATDVLRDCEETAPLRRREEPRFGSQAA